MGLGHSPKIVTDGLVLCLDASNVKSYRNYNLANYSQDFTNAVYTKSTGLVSATGLLAPDGTLTASTLTDDVNDTYDYFSRGFTVANDSSSYNVSIYIKKTTGGTSTRTGFNISFTGGTAKYYNVRFNADTGVIAGGDSSLVTSESNNYWRLSFVVSNNGTGNTVFAISYYPATGIYDGGDVTTAMGSHTVWGFQVTRGAALLPYKMNVDDSANIWIDLARNNNGTLTNGPAFDNNNLGSFVFDGTDKYINGSLPTVGAGASVTIEAVIKLNDVTLGTTKDIINQGRSGITFSYGMIIYGNNLRFRNSNSDHALSSPTALTTGVWYHLVLSSLGAVTTGYCNGISQGTAAVGVTTNSIVDYHISRRSSTSASEFMNGNIALIRVYNNRAFTSAEVQQNFNALRGRFSL